MKIYYTREVLHLSSHTRLIQLLPGHPLTDPKRWNSSHQHKKRTSLRVKRDTNKDHDTGKVVPPPPEREGEKYDTYPATQG